MGHFDHLNVAFFTKAAIYPGSQPYSIPYPAPKAE